MPRRLSGRLRPERRSAATRARLSAAASGSGLAGQCQRQMAAAPEGRRRAVVLARGNLEIHRTDAGRKSARFYLGQRREIGHHFPLPRKAGVGARSLRNPGSGLERPRQDQGGRCIVRRRRQLAQRPVAGADPVEGAHPLHHSLAVGRPAGAFEIACVETAMYSRPSRSCARCAAPIRSTTTIRSRPGRSSRTARYTMSNSARRKLLSLALLVWCWPAAAGSPGAFGYGKPATPAEIAGLEHRRARQRRRRPAGRQRHRRPRRRCLCRSMRRLPRHLRRRRRPLSRN